MLKKYSVLHGFFGNAGQPGILSRKLREKGINSESVIVGPNKYSYQSDSMYAEQTHETFRKIVVDKFPNHDIIHIHALTPFRAKRTCQFPMGIDLLIAKALGKKIIVHYRGSEIRKPSTFSASSPYNYVEENPKKIFDTFNDGWIESYIKLCTALADEVLVVDPELQTYVQNSEILQRAIDIDMWHYVGLKRVSRPLVVHAPSREAVKGTPAVLAAIESLKAEGLDFDFQLIQNLSNGEARALYEDADIIIDQLRIGWYGVLAIEGMALGKAVVSYIRDDLVSFFEGTQLPVANANPDTIRDVLRELILNYETRAQQARSGHEFCMHYHESGIVAEKAISLYDDVITRHSHFDLNSYMEIVVQQEHAMLEQLSQAKFDGIKIGRTKNQLSRISRKFRPTHVVKALKTRLNFSFGGEP